MRDLYDIDSWIYACIDEETGEITDPEAFEQISLERDKKIENIVLYVKNLRAEAEMYKAEKEAFAARQEQAERRAESLMKYLSAVLDGEPFETARCACLWRKSTAVEVDETKLPKKYMVYTPKPDKRAIRDAITAGIKVKGAQIVERNNLRIK